MNSDRKIAFLCHPYHRGGVTRWMADAALAYSKNKFEVYFVTVEPTISFFSGEGRETMLQLLRKTPSDIKIITAKAGRDFEFGLPDYVANIYKSLITENIPLGTPIILSDDGIVWQAAAALHKSYPLVGVLHADEPHYYQLAQKYKKEVDIFVCVSERINRVTAQQNPDLDKKRVFTIPCGIELPPPPGVGQANNVLSLVYVGRISEYQKRTGDILKIATQLKTDGINFKLNIIGDGGAYKTALVKSATEAGLDKQIAFKGWLSQAEVHQYLSSSDILLLASDFEGMPIAMMEGLASGCGFVGTRVSGIEDFEHHSLASSCFGTFDVGNIVEAVIKIKEIAAVPLPQRKKAARELAETQFSMEICIDKYKKAIGTIPTRPFEKTNFKLSGDVLLKSKFISTLRTLKMSLKK